MMKFAISFGAPIAIRYPRGEAYAGLREYRAPIELGNAELICAEGDVCLMALGSMVKVAEKVKELLNKAGHKCSIINARFAKPIDADAVKWAVRNHKLVVTMEENVAIGGYGEKVRDIVDGLKAPEKKSYAKVLQIAVPDRYVEHGSVEQLMREIGMDAESIFNKVKENL